MIKFLSVCMGGVAITVGSLRGDHTLILLGIASWVVALLADNVRK